MANLGIWHGSIHYLRGAQESARKAEDALRDRGPFHQEDARQHIQLAIRALQLVGRQIEREQVAWTSTLYVDGPDGAEHAIRYSWRPRQDERGRQTVEIELLTDVPAGLDRKDVEARAEEELLEYLAQDGPDPDEAYDRRWL